jgi:hypothetical protein
MRRPRRQVVSVRFVCRRRCRSLQQICQRQQSQSAASVRQKVTSVGRALVTTAMLML